MQDNIKYDRKTIDVDNIRAMVIDGSIPSAISDTGATSTAGKSGHPLRFLNFPSDKVFHLSTGGTTRASIKSKLMHELREPATEVDIVPGITNALLSTVKLEEVGCFAVYDENEVNIYDGKKVKIIITEEAVLKGYRCPHKKLWRIPLVKDFQNENTDTIILNRKDRLQSLNTRYQVPTTEDAIDTLHFMLDGAPANSFALASHVSLLGFIRFWEEFVHIFTVMSGQVS